jgi:hypothetical protein
MKYTTLPHTDIKVSKINLGTMTFGQQNTEAEGHQQMDYALERGVNFFDTAEMYSVPAREETYGSTEKIIGTWFKKSGNRDKVVLATKIAALLAFSAMKNNDLVGAIFFADGVEKYIPAKKGKAHILFILRMILSSTASKGTATQVGKALQGFIQSQKKRCLAFIISDFYTNNFQTELNIAAKKHELIGVHIYDNIEVQLPAIGLLPVQDAESGVQSFIIADKKNSASQKEKFIGHQKNIAQQFSKANAALLSIGTHQDFVNTLIQFFATR